jgi:FkbH-like protein
VESTLKQLAEYLPAKPPYAGYTAEEIDSFGLTLSLKITALNITTAGAFEEMLARASGELPGGAGKDPGKLLRTIKNIVLPLFRHSLPAARSEGPVAQPPVSAGPAAGDGAEPEAQPAVDRKKTVPPAETDEGLPYALSRAPLPNSAYEYYHALQRWSEYFNNYNEAVKLEFGFRADWVGSKTDGGFSFIVMPAGQAQHYLITIGVNFEIHRFFERLEEKIPGLRQDRHWKDLKKRWGIVADTPHGSSPAEISDIIFPEEFDTVLTVEQRSIIHELANLFEAEVNKGADRHILKILNESKRTLEKKIEDGAGLRRRRLLKPLSELIRSVRSQADHFPRHNLAYQALIVMVRRWPKKDVHCHVGPSLPESFVVDGLKEKEPQLRKKFEDYFSDEQHRDERSILFHLWEFLKPKTNWKELNEKDLKEIRKIFRSYSGQTRARTFVIQNLKEFKEALRLVIRRYFEDGVIQPYIRFNPLPLQEKYHIGLGEILKDFYGVVQKEERAKGKNCKVSFVLSFDREKAAPDDLKAYIEKYAGLKKESKQTLRKAFARVAAIDLAGKETEKTYTSQWKEVIALAREKGLSVFVHAGDLNNTTLKPEEQLEYLWELVTADDFDNMGHNTACSEEHLITGESRERYMEEKVGSKYRQRAGEILDKIAKQGITIEALPYSEMFEDGYNLRKHPFYSWYKRDDLRRLIVLGVDGISYGPCTLSQWIVALLLAAPLKGVPEAKRLTVSAVKNMVSISTDKRKSYLHPRRVDSKSGEFYNSLRRQLAYRYLLRGKVLSSGQRRHSITIREYSKLLRSRKNIPPVSRTQRMLDLRNLTRQHKGQIDVKRQPNGKIIYVLREEDTAVSSPALKPEPITEKQAPQSAASPASSPAAGNMASSPADSTEHTSSLSEAERVALIVDTIVKEIMRQRGHVSRGTASRSFFCDKDTLFWASIGDYFDNNNKELSGFSEADIVQALADYESSLQTFLMRAHRQATGILSLSATSIIATLAASTTVFRVYQVKDTIVRYESYAPRVDAAEHTCDTWELPVLDTDEACSNFGRLLPPREPVKKCLVLDCDNVMWKGVIGEEGYEGIKITEQHAAFQRAALRLQKRGIILAINSKNDQADIKKALDPLNPMLRMPLDKYHFAIIKANWQDKAQNLREIAAALNIGLESIVFIDDSPQEQALIHQLLPVVTVFAFPDDLHDVPLLTERLSWLFATPIEHRTNEDIRRTELYADRAAREELRTTASSLEEFYRMLAMHVTIREGIANLPLISRIAQLSERTNQFNLTLRRLFDNKVKAFLKRNDAHVYTMELSDRFGNAGIVGAMIIEEYAVQEHSTRRHARIELFCLSCRAIGYTLEKVFMSAVAARLRLLGLQYLDGYYVKGPRNDQVSALYPQLGFTLFSEGVWRAHLNSYLLETPAYIQVRNDSGTGASSPAGTVSLGFENRPRTVSEPSLGATVAGRMTIFPAGNPPMTGMIKNILFIPEQLAARFAYFLNFPAAIRMRVGPLCCDLKNYLSAFIRSPPTFIYQPSRKSLKVIGGSDFLDWAYKKP